MGSAETAALPITLVPQYSTRVSDLEYYRPPCVHCGGVTEPVAARRRVNVSVVSSTRNDSEDSF